VRASDRAESVRLSDWSRCPGPDDAGAEPVTTAACVLPQAMDMLQPGASHWVQQSGAGLSALHFVSAETAATGAPGRAFSNAATEAGPEP
jgi:hypothetical protein